jgi:phosphopantothenoylcysteine decarboxylase/phosphopantothenate--cysteine ligase
MLQGKKILLGVTGSIAAYKAALLTRLLVRAGAEVQVVMTEAATGFITPLTLSTLSKRPVLTVLQEEGQWNSHVALGRWSDIMLVAPASADTLARMAAGLCDNLLLAVYLSAACPVMVAPAMDSDMWRHPATAANLRVLQGRGVDVVPVGSGELASGLTGEGRMSEPEELLQRVQERLGASRGPLKGKRALVTAGPTQEPIDPVRFIGNHSSGRMGVALADELAAQGAEVSLVLGPSEVKPAHSGVSVTEVTTAAEMRAACLKAFPGTDIAVLAAAVADFRPVSPADKKIKKNGAPVTLELEKTADILAELGKRKKKGQFLAGFALETDHETENAVKKMRDKNLDLIVLNSLRDEGAGFAHLTNKVTFFLPDGRMEELPLQLKTEVAAQMVKLIGRLTAKENR